MQELTVIGVEDESLLVAAPDGTRFRLPIDDTLRSRVRQSSTGDTPRTRLSPREVQAHIRSGLSADEVARLTGASLEYIERFEGPVLAEREYIVQSALAVPVHTAEDPEPLGDGRTFGTVIHDRLAALDAHEERWASWKDANGWIVKLAFTAREVEHDARWQFEPRKSSLSPLNTDATSLSRQGEAPTQLIPRLRAVTDHDHQTDRSRFDSGVFSPLPVAPIVDDRARPESISAAAVEARTAGPSRLGERREPRPLAPNGQGADLLEALRRRRGEREAASFEPLDVEDAAPMNQRVRLIDIPLDDFDVENPEPGNGPNATQPLPVAQPAARQARKGRASMPSWDEIVFGARSDDDPA